ncbi:MAG: hypothetical protein Tsb0014_29300 [Pleurocapsa sp.]
MLIIISSNLFFYYCQRSKLRNSRDNFYFVLGIFKLRLLAQNIDNKLLKKIAAIVKEYIQVLQAGNCFILK